MGSNNCLLGGILGCPTACFSTCSSTPQPCPGLLQAGEIAIVNSAPGGAGSSARARVRVRVLHDARPPSRSRSSGTHPSGESSGFIARVRRPLVLDTCLLVAEEAPVPMGNELGDELRRLGERLEFQFALDMQRGDGAQRLGLLRFMFGLCAPEPRRKPALRRRRRVLG